MNKKEQVEQVYVAWMSLGRLSFEHPLEPSAAAGWMEDQSAELFWNIIQSDRWIKGLPGRSLSL